MYVLVPDEPNLGFIVVAVIFVSATLLGFASHSPGGLGVFDAAMLVGLWQMDREELSPACCCSACSTILRRLSYQ